jgi:hypothetical protein
MSEGDSIDPDALFGEVVDVTARLRVMSRGKDGAANWTSAATLAAHARSGGFGGGLDQP